MDTSEIQTSLEGLVGALGDGLSQYGPGLLGGLVILVVGWAIANWARRGLDRALGRYPRMDVTLRRFLASLVKWIILAVTFVAVLGQFGVQTTSLLAVLGAAGLAIGLALQGTLPNLAAGVMLLLFRPFRVGDYVDLDGIAGTVKSLDLFMTELSTPDNVQILVPNGKIWGAAIQNFSFYPTRRVDITLGIDYADNIDLALDTIRSVVDRDPRCLKDPEPLYVVGELADSSVNIIVRVWCENAEYWPLKFSLTKALKEALDNAGITIPFPQRVVHMTGEKAS